MSTQSIRRIRVLLNIAIVTACAFVLTTCYQVLSAQAEAATVVTPVATAVGTSASPAASGTTQVSMVTKATASLRHTPTGAVRFAYNASTKALNVTVTLNSLAPKSTHPVQIQQGNCPTPVAEARVGVTPTAGAAKIVYSLPNLVSDAAGHATVQTTIQNVAHGIPASGWRINVYNGPELKTADQKVSLSCRNITNAKNSNNVFLPLGSSGSPNESAAGQAQLSVHNNTLTVQINVHGLAPKTAHAAHIHAGSCKDTGQVLYNLSPLVADASGNVTKTMTFKGVSGIPSTGWDLNVHYGTNISNQTGYNPILCGNITPSK